MRRDKGLRATWIVAILALAGGFLGQSFDGGEKRVSFPAESPDLAPIEEEAVLVGAGDIAACDSTGDEATAKLLDRIPGTVFTVGGNVHETGKPSEFTNCYGPSWGRHLDRTYPVPGDHEYAVETGVSSADVGEAGGYFGYFGERAGEPGKGYYSYDLDGWHVIALNSMCDEVGGCDEGSSQFEWLQKDLAASDAPCTLAYWHHPLFFSGPHSERPEMKLFWEALYELEADVVVSGHDHLYERFSPQDPEGKVDPVRGIRQFVVGTGGKALYPSGAYKPNSELRSSGAHGIIKFILRPERYDYEFVGIEGSAFRDSGTGDCH